MQELQGITQKNGIEENQQAVNIMGVLTKGLKSKITKANENEIQNALNDMKRQDTTATVNNELANKLQDLLVAV